jgi:hypothetical protein
MQCLNPTGHLHLKTKKKKKNSNSDKFLPRYSSGASFLARAFTVSCLTWNSKQPKITQAKENCGLYIQKCWQSIIEKKGEDPWQVIGNRRRNGRKSNNKPTQQQREGVVRSSIVMVPWNEEDGTFYQVNIYSEVITARENLGQICT